jgi:hypothetical protein
MFLYIICTAAQKITILTPAAGNFSEIQIDRPTLS